MKPHYFDQAEADADDIQLQMAKSQGYVRKTCLLNGIVVMEEIRLSHNPCDGCAGPRDKCHGKPVQSNYEHFQPGVRPMTKEDHWETIGRK